MSETALALVSTQGALAVAVSVYLACLALPVPATAAMLAGGAFAASGDLAWQEVWGAAFAAAVAGDLTGYALGARGGPALLARLRQRPGRARLVDRAEAALQRHAAMAVFLTTWALAPLGPWVNFAAGAARMGWARFALWDIAGEVIWVSLYVGLGYAFAARLDALTEILGDWLGLVAAAGATLALGWVLWRRARQLRRDHRASA